MTQKADFMRKKMAALPDLRVTQVKELRWYWLRRGKGKSHSQTPKGTRWTLTRGTGIRSQDLLLVLVGKEVSG